MLIRIRTRTRLRIRFPILHDGQSRRLLTVSRTLPPLCDHPVALILHRCHRCLPLSCARQAAGRRPQEAGSSTGDERLHIHIPCDTVHTCWRYDVALVVLTTGSILSLISEAKFEQNPFECAYSV